MTGNLNFNGFAAGDAMLKRVGDGFFVRKGDDSGFGDLYVAVLKAMSFRGNQNAFAVDTKTSNDAYIGFRSYFGGYISTIELYRGNVYMPNLPVADPHIVGVLWNNGGVVTVSAG